MQQSGEFRLLKFIVFAMGIVLMLGTILLIFLVYQRNQAEIQVSALDKLIDGKCTKEMIEIGVEGDIEILNRKRKLLTAVERKEDSTQLILVDLCSGAVDNRVSFIKR